MNLQEFINTEREYMLRNLTLIVRGLQASMRLDPDEYTEHNDDEPSVDIRLCIDMNIPDHESTANGCTEECRACQGEADPSWIFRTGDVSFDPAHSEFCAASCVSLATKPEKLLAELIGQIEDDSY